MEVKNKSSSQSYEKKFKLIWNTICEPMYKFERYITLLLAIITALQFISILNFILVIFALFLLWDESLDKKYWRFFNCYIIFHIILKHFSNYLLNRQYFNIEIMSLLGLFSIEKDGTDHNSSISVLMVMDLLVIYFGSKWYLKIRIEENTKWSRRNTLLSQIDQLTATSLNFTGIKALKNTYIYFKMMLKYYSIWIYHILANLILLSDYRDILTVFLLTWESGTALLHIFIWKKGGSHPYRRIYKSWVLSYYFIIAYCLLRYTSLFVQYDYTRQLLSGIANIFGLNGDQMINKIRKDIGEKESQKYGSYVGCYIMPLLLLTTASINRLLLLSYFEQQEAECFKNESAMTFGDTEFEGHKNLSSRLMTRDAGITSSSGAVTPRRITSIQTNLLKKSSQDLEKTDGKELYQRELLGIKRRASHFIVMYMFFKALFTILITMLLQTRVTIFKFFMITCYLLNLRSIFGELHKLCTKFKVMELFSLRVRYFYLTFLTSKKWKHQSDADINFIQSYIETSEKIDIAQNKAYYEIFLHELEQILLRVNKVYWGLNYFPLVGLVALLSILNFVLPNTDFIQLYRFDRIFGIDQTVWNNWPLFSRELLYIQGVIVSLYLEYMLTSFYLDCRNDLTDMDDQACQTLLRVIETKYKVMICLREGKIKDELQADAYLAQYKEALQWNPKDRDRGQKGSLHRRTGTTVDKNSVNLISNELFDKCDIFQVKTEGLKDDENAKSKSVDEEDASQSNSVTPDSSNNSSVRNEISLSEIENFVDKSIESIKPEEVENDYRTNRSKSAMNAVNKSISAPHDRNEIAGLAMLKNKSLNDGTKDARVVFMSELTTKEEMLLLLFRNRYKFYFCKTLGAMVYSLPRLTMIPLVYPLVHTVNFTSLTFLITFMLRNSKACKTFMEDANQNSNLTIGYLISMMLHSFLHEALYSGEPGKDLTNANIYTRFIDNAYLDSVRSFVIPIDREVYFVSFYWTFVYSLGMCLLPYFLWMTTILLFKQTIRKKNTYWYYLLNKNRKRTVAIDYIKWRQSKWRFINVYYKTLHTNTVEAYAVVVMGTFMIYWHNVYMPLLFFTMVVILSERYRSERVDTESTRIYYLRKHKRITRLYITGYWCVMYFLHFIEFMGKVGFFSGYKNNRDKFMREFEGTFLILCLLVGACIVRDLLYSEDFIKINHKIKTDRELKLKYSGLIKSYEHNERKIYKRIVDISRKDILDEVSESCLDTKKQLSLINFIKDQDIRDVVEIIDDSFNSILSKYVSTINSLKIKATDYIYQFLISRTEPYNGEDLMIMFDAFKVRNGAHIQTIEINLEDYFDDNLSFFSKSYDKVTRFYNLLGSENELDVKIYDEAVNKQLSITCETPEPRYQDAQNDLSRLAGRSRLFSYADANRNINSKLSADILFSALTSKDQYGACSSLETYKVAFKKNGYMDCYYGMTRVTLYNLNANNYLDSTDGYTKFSLGIVMTIIRKVLIDRFDKIAAFTLIILYVIYGGFMNVIILGVLIFNVYIEETTGRSRAWLILYSLMTILMIAKRFYILFSNQLIAHFFLGDLDSNYDIYSLIIVVTTIQALKQYSPDSKASVDYENPAIAMARLTINQDFRAMIGRIALSAIRRKEALKDKLITIGVSNVDSISEEDFKLIMIKQLISNKITLKRFKTEGVQLANRLLRSLRFDYLKLSRKKIESFFYRNFSYHLRKPGKDYFSFVSILYIFMIFFILLFFPTLGSEKASIASFLFDNTVTAFTVLNFTIYLTFFLIHFSFDQVKATDNGGLKAKHYTIKLLEGIKVETPNNIDLKPIARLKRAVNLVKNAITLRRVRNSDFNIFKDSPHFYLFIATLFLWIYMNISVFFWHSYHGNAKSPVKIGIYKFICEPKDNVRESGETNLQDCSNFNQRLPSQLFYFLNTIYFIVCMYQIRDGKVIIKSKIGDYGSQFKRIIFRLYTFAPLVRETEYTFEYCATHTSLNFTDYLLVKEIEHSMTTAKVIQLSRTKTKTGKTVDHRLQNIICFAIIPLLIGIICLPLYLFYDDAGVSFYPIISASIKIDVYIDKTVKMMNLVSLEKLSENRLFDYEKDRQTINLLNNTDVLKRYPLMQLRVAYILPSESASQSTQKILYR